MKKNQLELMMDGIRQVSEALFDNTGRALLIVEPESEYIFMCNSLAVSMFHADSREELLMRPMSSLINFTIFFKENFSVFKNLKLGFSEDILEKEFLTCRGVVFDGKMVVQEAFFDKNRFLVISIEDLTERTLSQKSITKRSIELELFSLNINRLHQLSLKRFYDLESLYDSYLERCLEIFRISDGMIIRFSDNTTQIQFDDIDSKQLPSHIRSEIDEIFLHELKSRKDTIAYLKNRPSPEIKSTYPFSNLYLQTFFGTPILVNNKVYGAICLFSRELRVGKFKTYDIELFETIANLIGQHIEVLQATLKQQAAEITSEQFFQFSLDMLAIMNFEGAFENVNPVILNTLGYSKNECLSKQVYQFVHPSDRKDFLLTFSGLLEKDSISHTEARFITKSGETCWISWKACSVRSQQLIYVNARDITQQKASETALRDSEERYRFLIENQTEIVCRFLPENGLITFANDAFSRFFDVKPNMFIGENFLDYFGKKNAKLIHKKIGIENRFKAVTKLQNSNKKVYWLQWIFESITDSKQQIIGYLAVGRDITDLKENEIALQVSQSQSKALLNAIPDLMFRVNTLGKCLDYKLDKASEKEIDLSLPKDALASFTGNYFNLFLMHIENAIKYKEAQLFEFNRVRQGEVNYYETRIEKSGKNEAICILHDVTQLKNSTKALLKSKSKGQALLNAIPDMMLHVNPDGIIYDSKDMEPSNPALSIGFEQKKHIETVFPKKVAEQILSEMKIAIDEQTVRIFEFSIAHKHHFHEFEARITHSESLNYLIIIRDITPRKVIENKLKKSVIELKKARNEAQAAANTKAEFLATMSHEIRTPMNGVIGMATLLTETNLTEEQLEYVETLRTSGDSLMNIINDILDFSKIEAGKIDMEVVQFTLLRTIEEVIELFSPTASKKGVSLNNYFLNDIPQAVLGDSTRLKQVLSNLISNAIKFTQKGVVELNVKKIKETKTHTTIQFKIQDSGIGIPKEQIGKLFQAFSQIDASTTRKFGGTGLGLIISKKLVELNGGEIWVESEENVGSTFYFTSVFKKTDTIDNQQVYADLSAKKVFVLESNPVAQQHVLQLLSNLQIDAVVFENVISAIENLRKPNNFELGIINDDVFAQQFAQAYVKNNSNIKQDVILCIHKHILAEFSKVESDIFTTIINKPFRQNTFLQTVSEYFNQYQKPEKNVIKSHITLDKNLAKRIPLRVLLAEDNLVNQKFATRLLSKMGYEIDIAHDGLAAVEQSAKTNYDIIFMDMQMPKMDGLTATREIIRNVEQSKRPRIIAMTANAMKGDRERCLEAGMDDYISKPIKISKLQDMIIKWGSDNLSD